MKKQLDQVYAHARGAAQGFLDEYYRRQNPFETAKQHKVSVHVHTLLPLGETSWRVGWREEARNLDGLAIQPDQLGSHPDHCPGAAQRRGCDSGESDWLVCRGPELDATTLRGDSIMQIRVRAAAECRRAEHRAVLPTPAVPLFPPRTSCRLREVKDPPTLPTWRRRDPAAA